MELGCLDSPPLHPREGVAISPQVINLALRIAILIRPIPTFAAPLNGSLSRAVLFLEGGGKLTDSAQWFRLCG